jgi:hypothetical protein
MSLASRSECTPIPQHGHQLKEQSWILLNLSRVGIALNAKQPANTSSSMAMINM